MNKGCGVDGDFGLCESRHGEGEDSKWQGETT
jgi:hypothetical protein